MHPEFPCNYCGKTHPLGEVCKDNGTTVYKPSYFDNNRQELPQETPFDKLIQDAQEAAGNRRYVEGIDACINAVPDGHYIKDILIKLKAAFLETI